ncbi:phage tail protein [Streptomyces sp. NPDC127098]|uniref:phage tail protein n=1 Tax=Streptomyces sp. NPDC127098 TaxID=3347137 RepID=UPI00365D845B
MRGSVDGLASSSPIAPTLPAVFADDDLMRRFVGGLDDILAPILNVLDCLAAYFGPDLAPLDFVRWLGTWVGAETDIDEGGGRERHGQEEAARLRAAVGAAAYLHRIRGTRRGLSEAVRLAFGVEPEISESGGAAWSAEPFGPMPGQPRPRLHVHLRLVDPMPTDEHRLDTLVAAARPAHMPYTVQVTALERTQER